MHTADCIRHTGPAALSSGCLEHRLAALRTAARLLLVSDYVVSWRFWRYLTSLFLTCLSIYEDGDGRERCWLVVNGYISSAKTRTVFWYCPTRSQAPPLLPRGAWLSTSTLRLP